MSNLYHKSHMYKFINVMTMPVTFRFITTLPNYMYDISQPFFSRHRCFFQNTYTDSKTNCHHYVYFLFLDYNSDVYAMEVYIICVHICYFWKFYPYDSPSRVLYGAYREFSLNRYAHPPNPGMYRNIHSNANIIKQTNTTISPNL